MTDWLGVWECQSGVDSVCGINSWSWNGKIVINGISLYSLPMVELWTIKGEMEGDWDYHPEWLGQNWVWYTSKFIFVDITCMTSNPAGINIIVWYCTPNQTGCTPNFPHSLISSYIISIFIPISHFLIHLFTITPAANIRPFHSIPPSQKYELIPNNWIHPALTVWNLQLFSNHFCHDWIICDESSQDSLSLKAKSTWVKFPWLQVNKFIESQLCGVYSIVIDHLQIDHLQLQLWFH